MTRKSTDTQRTYTTLEHRYTEALKLYDNAIEEISRMDKNSDNAEPERLEDEDTEEYYVRLCKTSRSEHDDVKKIDDIIDQTVEEATLTKEVKERLKLLEGTEENGSKAAKIDPDLANRMLHNLKRKCLAEKLRNTYRSVHSSLLTNCSLVLFRLERYEDSRDRALNALKNFPTSRKALHRSALARAKLKSAVDSERAIEDMASSIAMAQKSSKSMKSSRVALYEMSLESSFIFFHESEIRLEDGKNDEKKRGRRLIAEKHFRPGDVMWTESSFLLSRVASYVTAEKVQHRDALVMLLSKRTYFFFPYLSQMTNLLARFEYHSTRFEYHSNTTTLTHRYKRNISV